MDERNTFDNEELQNEQVIDGQCEEIVDEPQPKSESSQDNAYQSQRNDSYEYKHSEYTQSGYTQNGYQQNGYQPNNQPSNGFAIASLVMGIIALMGFCTCINVPIAIVAIAFGIIHLAKNGKNGMAIAGIITAGASILLMIIVMVFYSAVFIGSSAYQDIPYYIEHSYEDTF